MNQSEARGVGFQEVLSQTDLVVVLLVLITSKTFQWALRSYSNLSLNPGLSLEVSSESSEISGGRRASESEI